MKLNLSASALPKDRLAEFRAEALRRFEELPWPARSDEEWRRTDIAALEFSSTPARARPLPGFDTIFEGQAMQDGEKHAVSGEGVETIVASGQTAIGSALDRSEKKFSSLNDAYFYPGVAALVRMDHERPLNLVSVFRGGVFFARSLAVVESGRSAVVLDELLGDPESQGLCVSHLEIRVQAGATLSLIRLQNLPRDATHFGTIHAALERDARLELTTVELGASVSKTTLDVNLGEAGARFVQNGVVRGMASQHFDLLASVRHRAPRTESHLLVKCALWDKSRSVFTGTIEVAKGAAKTDAYQKNLNLLLSKGARADSIPKLEILADDVKCGHGSATGSLDPEQVFYLQSRGLSPGEAERLIVAGFFEDVVGRAMAPEWIRENMRHRVLKDAA